MALVPTLAQCRAAVDALDGLLADGVTRVSAARRARGADRRPRYADPDGALDAEAVEGAIARSTRASCAWPSPTTAAGGERVGEAGGALYFRVRGLETTEAGPFEYHDKCRSSAVRGGRGAGGAAGHGALRRVPAPGRGPDAELREHRRARGRGTMVDTWATVGSCAQIGADVHLSGGVGIGGVLEPPQAAPVIVEDGCFIGSRVRRRRGRAGRPRGRARRRRRAHRRHAGHRRDRRRAGGVSAGEVPAARRRDPGHPARAFPAGDYGLPCGLIIGYRTGAPTTRCGSTSSCATPAPR